MKNPKSHKNEESTESCIRDLLSSPVHGDTWAAGRWHLCSILPQKKMLGQIPSWLWLHRDEISAPEEIPRNPVSKLCFHISALTRSRLSELLSFAPNKHDA